MKRFIQGEHRGQSTLLPESLDDYASDTKPVRVVDGAFDAGLQDYRQPPKRQPQGYPRRLSPVCGAVSAVGIVQ